MSSEQEFRQKIQHDLYIARQQHRNKQRDKLRCGLDTVKEELTVYVSESEILKLCNRIKRRKHSDDSDLIQLGKGFLSTPQNIVAFLKTQGALNVLVKDLTSSSSGDKQMLAAEAFCNLSLGDETSCLKISKQIATYIVDMTTSQNSELAQTCLWTLYNLLAESGDRVHQIFHAQGVHLKLVAVLQSNVDISLKIEASKCLSVVVASTVLDDW